MEPPSRPNDDQTRCQAQYWNRPEAGHWLVHERRYERMLAPFTRLVLGAAAVARLCAVEVDDMNILGGYRRGRRRESPRGVTRLHAMGTQKFPPRGVSPPPRAFVAWQREGAPENTSRGREEQC